MRVKMKKTLLFSLALLAVGSFQVQSSTFDANSPACEVVAPTSSLAKSQFAQQCPDVPDSSRDCDPVTVDGNRSVMCANYRLGLGPLSIRPRPLEATTPVLPPEEETIPTPPVQPPSDAPLVCEGNSRAEVIQQCGDVPVDCDIIVGVLNCANYQIGSRAPVGVPTLAELTGETVIVDPVEDEEEEITPPVQPSEPRSVLAPSAAQGYALFQLIFGVPAVDCDPEGNLFRCSDERIGSGGGGTSPVTPITPEIPVIGNVIRLEAESDSASDWVNRGTYIEWRGGNFFFGPPDAPNLSYSFTVPATGVYGVRYRAMAAQQTAGRPDLHNDAFVRMNGNPVAGELDAREYIRMLSTGDGNFHIQGTIGGEERGPFRQMLTAGVTYNLDVLGRSTGYAIDYFEIFPISTSSTPSPVSGNLIALHYDVCPDLDDVHALTANAAVIEGRSETISAVIGTCGISIRDRYNDDAENLFFEIHPDGLNADSDFNGSVIEQARRWNETLASGFEVFVAEGGQSDFTAEVVRLITEDRSRITVVQHAPSYNEGNTNPSNLTFLRNNVNYVNIPNGNQNNSNANLATWQLGIYDPDGFVDSALESEYSDLWVQAFGILSPFCRPQSFQCRVDFSDTVELLYIIGDTTTTDANDFASRYF